jgi:protein-S-isoprenylcysteine O-methyltransferase Ste14
VLVTLVFWLYYERIMFAEEEFLRRSFGPVYEEWAARTPAFLPDLARWTSPALPFCWRTVLKREYSSMFAIFASFVACELVEQMLATGVPMLGPWWALTFAVSTLAYLTLLAMKKWTKVLAVPGR